jgi:hypothetical protein
LEETRPIYIIGGPFKWSAIRSDIRRFHHINELATTCRQLHLETINMGFSKQHVYSIREKSSIPTNVGPARLVKYDHMLALHHDTMYHFEDYIRFANDRFHRYICFANDRPRIETTILTRSLRIELGTRELLVRGAAIQLLLRGKKVSFTVDTAFASEVNRVVEEMAVKNDTGSVAAGQKFPDNLRIFPQETYNEEALRYSYLRKKKGFEDWVAQIREWYEYGI